MNPMSLDVLIRDAIRNQVNDRRLRALDDSHAAFDAVDVDTLAPWSYDLLMLNTSLRAFAVRPDGQAPNSVEHSALSATMFAAAAGPRDDDDDEDEDDDVDDVDDDVDDDLDEDDFEDDDEEEAEDDTEVSLEDLENDEEEESGSDDFGAMDDDDDDDLDWDEDEDEDEDLLDDDED